MKNKITRNKILCERKTSTVEKALANLKQSCRKISGFLSNLYTLEFKDYCLTITDREH